MRSRPVTTRSTSARRAALGVGAALAAAGTLAACGPNTATGSGASAPATRPKASSGPQGVSGTVGAASALSAARTATADAKSARLALTVDTTTGGHTQVTDGGGVTGLSSGSSARGDFTLTTAGQQISIKAIGPVLYVKLPDNTTTRQISGGKLWVKVNTTTLALGSQLSGAQVPDAAAQLDWLDQVKNVTEVGSQNVGGVPTTHYRATVQPRAGAGAGKPVSAFPVDVWVDAQHRVRQEKLAMTVTTSPGSSSAASSGSSSDHGSVRVAITMGLSDFGTPLHVTAPPADQVTNLS